PFFALSIPHRVDLQEHVIELNKDYTLCKHGWSLTSVLALTAASVVPSGHPEFDRQAVVSFSGTDNQPPGGRHAANRRPALEFRHTPSVLPTGLALTKHRHERSMLVARSSFVLRPARLYHVAQAINASRLAPKSHRPSLRAAAEKLIDAPEVRDT
ncbi:unnamed protein product, partial [Clonostachys rosea]